MELKLYQRAVLAHTFTLSQTSLSMCFSSHIKRPGHDIHKVITGLLACFSYSITFEDSLTSIVIIPPVSGCFSLSHTVTDASSAHTICCISDLVED